MSQNLNEITLVIDQEVRTYRLQGQAPLSDVLSRISNTSSNPNIVIPGLYNAGGHPVSLVFVGENNPNPCSLFVWAPKVIQLNCTINADSTGVVMPHFGRENPAENLLGTLMWEPPVPVLFALEPAISDGKWTAANVFCIAISDGQTVKPPLPNCHNDGRLCVGARCPGFKTLQELVEWVITDTRDSVWNADLLNKDELRRWLRFRPEGDGLKQLPVEDLPQAKSLLRPVSHTLLSVVARHIAAITATT